uniref:hypothetical protein n=1 Tax=Goniotrichopsis reniformis TaxID=468933 RepID=UPI001FCD8DC9|nr:hypothetical protein MW428_pgp146 [Goniotrichopsis reniformis]UNJ14752.1 hypothetical protein [Goniotrichopsis reniformis]
MQKTYFFDKIQNFLHELPFYSISYTAIKIVNLLIGFFISTVMTTIVSQTGDWGIVAGAITITYIELMSSLFYSKRFNNKIIANINSLKIGILYGLFVEALCDLFVREYSYFQKKPNKELKQHYCVSLNINTTKC